MGFENIVRKTESKTTNASLQLLLEHGLRQGHLSRSDVIDCIPTAEYDNALYETILESIADAGIPFVELDEDERKQEEVEEADLTVEETDVFGPGAFSNVEDLENVETDDIVRLYIREASRVPLLTAQEEVDLAKRIERCRAAQQEMSETQPDKTRQKELNNQIQSGTLAREHLIRANARLVISVAKKYIGRGLPFLDLIQEGNIGLMRAIRNFDYHRGFKFSTYATWWIRQAVTRALAEQSRTIRLPVYMSDQVNRMLKEQNMLQQKLGRLPTTAELAEVLGVAPSKVEQMLEVVKHPLSLQTPVGEDEEDVLGDLIEDTGVVDPEESIIESLQNEDLKKKLQVLPPRELQVLQLRYGLEGDEPLTLNEVGQRMGITRERARQLESQAINRLRNPEKTARRRRKANVPEPETKGK